MTAIGIQDVLALRSLEQGVEMLGFDPGVGVALNAALLAVLACWAAFRAGRVALRAGRGVRGYLFPAPPAPPEPDAIVKRVCELLESPGADWRPGARDDGSGVVTSGSLAVAVESGGVLRAMTSGGQDVWMDVGDSDRAVLRKAVAEAVARLKAQQREQRRSAALNALNGGGVQNVLGSATVVNRDPAASPDGTHAVYCYAAPSGVSDSAKQQHKKK